MVSAVICAEAAAPLPAAASGVSATAPQSSSLGFSFQFGRASTPMIPQRVQTIRGPNKVGTGTSSGQGSELMIAEWWQTQHETLSKRTPFARMLPRVIALMR
jgi:hypothetical protein